MQVWYCLARSMKTCLNISATCWPAMPVAKATRHSRNNPGPKVNLGYSRSITAVGQRTEGNWDYPEVSR